jgi:hypothetical protein
MTPKNQENLSNQWDLPHKNTLAVKVILEIFLVTASYLFSYGLKHGIVSIFPPVYMYLFFVYLLIWVSLSFYNKKYHISVLRTQKTAVKILLNQSTVTLLVLSAVCSLTSLHSISRLFLFQIVYFPTLVELVAAIIFVVYRGQNIKNRQDRLVSLPTEKISYNRIVLSAALLIAVFIGLHLSGYSSFESYASHEATILLLIFSWLISSMLTGKSKPHSGQNRYYKFAPFLKSSIIMILFCGAIYYFARLENFLIKYDLFMTAGLFGIIEMTIAAGYFKFKKHDEIPVLMEKHSHFGQELLGVENADGDDTTMLNQLKSIEFNSNNEITKHVDVFFKKRNINPTKFRVFYIEEPFNIQLFKAFSRESLMNYYLINDIPAINEYFNACHRAVTNNGYLMGLYTPQELVRKSLEESMPRLVFAVYYPFHYFFKRVIPKLPVTAGLYTIITRGRRRLISRVELWGRLAYAGFVVEQESPVNGHVLFIAQKKLTPAREKYPSTGPLIKLKRIGYHGKTIRIFKLRTMFPYSEFIQNILFESEGFQESGDKINNDFRKTSLGIIMRKFWIDEIPQLYNWLKGDISLVGVRALSQHKYDLYPKDLQKLRIMFKPGLIPPFYADMPKNFDELIESERNYLIRKQEHHLRTDVIYFWKAAYNIIIKGARSQ